MTRTTAYCTTTAKQHCTGFSRGYQWSGGDLLKSRNRNMASHELVKLYIEEQRRILDVFPVDDVCRVVDLIWDAYTQDKTVYAFANGGGAGLVGNLVCDLSNHPFVFEDKTVPYPDDLRRLKVRNLSVDASMLTGVANDLGYAEVFARPLQTELEARDV